MENIQAAKTLDEVKERVVVAFKQTFAPDVFVALHECKKALRRCCLEQAALVDVPKFLRDNPDVYDLPTLNFGGAAGTIREAITGSIATHVHRSLPQLASNSFFAQFDDRTQTLLLELTDRSLKLFPGRPTGKESGLDWYNNLSGLRNALSVELDRDIVVETLTTLANFSEWLVEGDLVDVDFTVKGVADLRTDIEQVAKLLTNEEKLDQLFPKMALTM